MQLENFNQYGTDIRQRGKQLAENVKQYEIPLIKRPANKWKR